MTYQEVLATYKTGSVKKKKDRFSHFNMATNWLYKIG